MLTARDVGAKANIPITCVVDESQTDRVLRSMDGALLRDGAIVIIASTISPSYCQDLARELARRRIDVLDCPVSGGRARAADAGLGMLCGGGSGVVARCQPALESMGQAYHCGPLGMEHVAKLINQGNCLASSNWWTKGD